MIYRISKLVFVDLFLSGDFEISKKFKDIAEVRQIQMMAALDQCK